MAGSPAFEWLCEALERSTSLNRLEARGTVRIALKEAGFEARSVGPPELAVVARRVLPRELRQRGVEGEDRICERLAGGLAALHGAEVPGYETPDAIFRRLGGER